jgi:alcohol dehydrogenase
MDLSAGFTFTCPYKINSGNRALEHLPVELSSLNAVKPMIITSLDLAGQKAIRTLTAAFGDSGMTMGVFDGVTDAADLTLIEHLKGIIIKNQYDALIALGGGVVVDAAKVLNLAVSLKVADARQLSGETAVKNPLAPLVVIPTAAATGLETSKYAILNRMAFVSIHLTPNLVVLDPRMTGTKDGKIMAAAGLAALGRALEAYIAPDKNPFMDAYASTVLRFIRGNLVRAVKNTGDQKAALAVANAVAMSGCVVSNAGRGVLHRLGQMFHEMFHVPPGIIMGMCLPSVLADDLNRNGNLVSALLHPLAGDDEYTATPKTKRADAAFTALCRFLDEVYGSLEGKMPRTLKEVGIPNYMLNDIFESLDREPDGAYLRTVIERVWQGSPAVRTERS